MVPIRRWQNNFLAQYYDVIVADSTLKGLSLPDLIKKCEIHVNKSLRLTNDCKDYIRTLVRKSADPIYKLQNIQNNLSNSFSDKWIEIFYNEVQNNKFVFIQNNEFTFKNHPAWVTDKEKWLIGIQFFSSANNAPTLKPTLALYIVFQRKQSKRWFFPVS